MKNEWIYLDHAAATPPYAEVLQAWSEREDLSWANPSSIHQLGQKARNIIDESRYSCAQFFEVPVGGITFTSGATESMHLAIIGSALARSKSYIKILVSPLSHQCVWSALHTLSAIASTQVDLVPLTDQGYFDTDKLTIEYLSQYDLIIAEHGNSEVGLLQDIKLIGERKNQIDSVQKPIFIVDIAASIVTEEVRQKTLHYDIAIASAEKFGGVGGSGILIKNTTTFVPLVGGSQELGLRGGTENTRGIFCLSKALESHQKQRITSQKNGEYLWHILARELEQKSYTIITPKEKHLSHILHFLVREGTGQDLVIKADLQGICIASGPACSSGSIKPSTVLTALGYTEKDAKRGVRVSFGRDTKKDDILAFLKLL